MFYRVLSFDMPLIQFQNCPFETRYEILLNSINVDHPHTVSLHIFDFFYHIPLKEEDGSNEGSNQ